MKFTTIWTIPAMTLSERMRRTREWAAMTAASKLPLRVKYWAGIQQLAAASTKDPHQVVPEMTMTQILQAMPAPKNVA
jgi:hypothetical protein